MCYTRFERPLLTESKDEQGRRHEQGEASGIAGKSGGTAGLQRGRIRDHGTRPDHNLFARSGLHSVENRYTESVSAKNLSLSKESAVRYNNG